jgi:hypothetical protein
MNAKQERLLRQHIRKRIAEKHEVALKEQKVITLQENRIRNIIRGILINEASDVNFETMSQSTGINVLRQTIKKVSGILQRSYMTMTSSKEQRESFRAHILRNVVDLFIRVDLLSDNDEAGEGEEAVAQAKAGSKTEPQALPKEPTAPAEEEPAKGKEELEEEIDVDVNDDEEDADAVPAKPAAPVTSPDQKGADPGNFAKMDKEQEQDLSKQVKAKEFIKLPGEDPTGRNIASETFPLISTSIAEDYAILSLQKDKEDYKNYMLANLKAYFDQYEQKIAANVSEPYSAEYEKVKGQYTKYEQPSQEQIAESASYFKVLKILTNGKKIL